MFQHNSESEVWLKRTLSVLKASGLEGKSLSRAIASAIRETKIPCSQARQTVAKNIKGSMKTQEHAQSLLQEAESPTSESLLHTDEGKGSMATQEHAESLLKSAATGNNVNIECGKIAGGALQPPDAAALAQRVLHFMNQHLPRQPNLGLHVRQAATCLPAPVVEKLQTLHRHTAGARHGAALACPVGEDFLVELQQAVHLFRATIEQRLVALEAAQSVALARIELLEQARFAAPLEPDCYDKWFARGDEVHEGSMDNPRACRNVEF